MVTVDFGSLATQTADGSVADCVFVFDFLDVDGLLVSHYVDCVPMYEHHESKDWCYVRSSLWALHNAGFFFGFDRIIWWSDTGPNHFRVSSTLFCFREFQEKCNIKMEINFFCPYHGHNVCDGHIGCIAKVYRFG